MSPRMRSSARLVRVHVVFGGGLENLADAVEPRERLGDLRADRRNRHHRRRHQADEEDVHDEVAERHPTGENVATAEPNHDHADDADDHGAASRGRGDARHRLRHVPEQPVSALGEHDLFALLRGIALDDANAAQRLGEAPRHLGVDLAALTEQRTQCAEGVGHADAKQRQDDDRDDGQTPVEIEQHAESEHRGDDATHELHEPRADEVPDAVGIAHDARKQHSALRRVEIANRQTHDARLDALAHLGDGTLRRDAEDLGVDEGRDRLNCRRQRRRRWQSASSRS